MEVMTWERGGTRIKREHEKMGKGRRLSHKRGGSESRGARDETDLHINWRHVEGKEAREGKQKQ